VKGVLALLQGFFIPLVDPEGGVSVGHFGTKAFPSVDVPAQLF
jgi:hypothetical protein